MGLQKALLVLLAVQAWSKTKAQEFPKMKEIFIDSYQTEVQITDLMQNASAFATEYYSGYQMYGRLDLMVFGERKSIFYYNDTGDLLDVNATSCIAAPVEETLYGYTDIFYGWLCKSPLVIGPTALLWNAQLMKPDPDGQETVRGILCDKFKLSIDGPKDNGEFTYYFAVKEWTTAFKQMNLRVPVRVVVSAASNRGLASEEQIAEYEQIVDFSYFRSPLADDGVLQPDTGLGCFGRQQGRMIPKIPREFQFRFESYDLAYAEKHEYTDINYGQIFFSTRNQLARIDAYTKTQITSEIHDFRNGVKYSIKNFETCKIKPLRSSFFENEDDDLMGSIKTPEEVLGMSGDFYYMGTRTMRGINCRVFEKAVKNVYYNDNFYYMLVVTAYFTEEFMKVVNSGESMTSAPVYTMVTGYENRNEVSFQMEYNVVGFDDIVGPAIYQDFDIQSCFPLSKQQSYFVLSILADETTARTLESVDEEFLEILTAAIINKTDISAIRLPYLKADYQRGGIDVTGLLLDRPPALSQFWFVFEGDTKSSDFIKPVPDAKNEEQCAFACIGGTECKAFHFCSGACFLNTEYITDHIINGIDMGVCKVYNRAEINSNARDLYLPQVLDTLKKVVKDGKLIIDLPIESLDKNLKFKIDNVIFSEGPFEREVTDKAFNMVFNGYQLPSKDDAETTGDRPDATTLNDCYRACKEDTTMDCSSFSYCLDDYRDKQCRISSLLMVGDKTNYGDIITNKNCNIYSLMYLDFYEPYPGKMLMINGERSFTQTGSPEECAMKCRTNTEIKCRGFEYCSSRRTCVLHSKHVLDLNQGEIATSVDNQCTHYASKFVADYYDMGYTLIEDDSDKRTKLTLEECARACSEEVATCKSFNYCPPSTEFANDASCALTSKTLGDRGIKLTSNEKCHSYTKREHVEDWGRPKRAEKKSGYTRGAFTSLIIGMLAFGLIVGVAGFVGYSYYRSRQSSDGMTVRFMKQTNA